MKTTEDPSSDSDRDSASHPRLVLHLGAGDVVQRGDLFLDDHGNYREMDHLGRLLGTRCLGQTLKKSGAWFRPLKQNAASQLSAPAGGASDPNPGRGAGAD